MRREIKFKGYYKLGESWFEGNPNYIDPDNGKCYDWVTNFGEHDLEEDTDYVLCQYTGLKDVHGKEIYESDVVKNKYGRVCEVYWQEHKGSWDLKALNIEGHTHRYFQWDHWEVIGNIYENKDLTN